MSPLIVVVDDEPAVRRVTCGFLEAAGYECLGAPSATVALAALESPPLPDLLVVDVRLPDMSGPELALRIHTRHSSVPVLFVSGWVDGLADSALLDALDWSFLAKPFTAEHLAAAVQRLLPRTSTESRQA